jgi:outer membrane protein OmpA-like peptidoglycan-associated protein
MNTYQFYFGLFIAYVLLHQPIKAQIYWGYGISNISDDKNIQQATQLLGEPNTDDNNTMSDSACTIRFRGASKPSITIGFDKLIYVQKIFIAENYGISPKEVFLIDEQGKERDKYVINDNFDISLDILSKVSHITLYKRTSYLVSAVKIIINPPFLGEDICQIDAVGLSEYDVDYIKSPKKTANTDVLLASTLYPASYEKEAGTQAQEEEMVLSTRISGKIVSDAIRNIIANAEILFTNQQDTTSSNQVVVANEEGTFEINLKKNATYTMIGKKEGYIASTPQVVTIKSIEAKNFTLNLDLVKLPTDSTYNFYNIEFLPNSLDFEDKSYPVLERILHTLISNPSLYVGIYVHTDSRGNDEYNLQLTKQRAEVVVNYLSEKGINRQRLTPQGFGEQKIINQCTNGVLCSNVEHLQNRRVEFKILAKEPVK